jgi:hypothetical protein
MEDKFSLYSLYGVLIDGLKVDSTSPSFLGSSFTSFSKYLFHIVFQIFVFQ